MQFDSSSCGHSGHHDAHIHHYSHIQIMMECQFEGLVQQESAIDGNTLLFPTNECTSIHDGAELSQVTVD